MHTTIKAFALFIVLIPALAYAQEPQCTYSIDPATSQVEWTAFKTTAKVGVKGQFTKFTVTAPAAPSVSQLLQGLQFTIDTTSVSTGDTNRDGIIVAFFFQQMVGPAEIKGGIEKVSGQDKGEAQVRVFMNSESELVPMAYQVNPKNQLTATGQLDIMNFGAGQAMSALSQACFEKHKGPDAVSKTWSEVQLKITSTLNKDCSGAVESTTAKASLIPNT